MKGIMRLVVLLTVVGFAAWGMAAMATGPETPASPGAESATPSAPVSATVADAKTGPAPAWAFDPPHCSVMFFVRHILAKVPGRFDSYSGTVRFDPANLGGSSIDVSVEMGSVNTGVAARDEHLKSPDFFDVPKYPGMRFVSQRIASRGGGDYVAEGDLTIKDVTKRIQLPFTYLGTKPSPLEQGKHVAGFEARFSINMLEYHVGDGRFQQMGALGDTVEIVINLEMLR